MRLRLFDRVRRYIRPRPGGARSRGGTRPGSPAVSGTATLPPAGRHRRDHMPGAAEDSGLIAALRAVQESTKRTGLDKLTERDIDAKVSASRRERDKRTKN